MAPSSQLLQQLFHSNDIALLTCSDDHAIWQKTRTFYHCLRSISTKVAPEHVGRDLPTRGCRLMCAARERGRQAFTSEPSNENDPSSRSLSRRDLFAGSLGAGIAGVSVQTQNAEAFAAAAPVEALPLVPPGRPIAEGLIPSSVIKGCWQLAGGHRGDQASDRTSGQAAVEDFQPFVDAGITTFDTADIYGPSESLIGDYVRKHGRAGLQIFTKYCVFSPSELRNPTREAVRRSIERSCKNLRVNSLDLVQFYWNDYGQPNFLQAAQYLAELQAEGKIRHIGVTNFDTRRVQAMIDSGVKVVSSQVQYSLLDRRAENGHAQFCRANAISLLPFGVIGGSFLTDRYVGMTVAEAQSVIKVDTYSKSKYLSVLSKVGGWEFLQALLDALKQIGDKHGVSVSNVAARWVLDRPQVAGVIIGARNARHVNDHRRLFSFSLDDEDRAQIDGVLERGPQPQGDIYTWERGGSF